MDCSKLNHVKDAPSIAMKSNVERGFRHMGRFGCMFFSPIRKFTPEREKSGCSLDVRSLLRVYLAPANTRSVHNRNKKNNKDQNKIINYLSLKVIFIVLRKRTEKDKFVLPFFFCFFPPFYAPLTMLKIKDNK